MLLHLRSHAPSLCQARRQIAVGCCQRDDRAPQAPAAQQAHGGEPLPAAPRPACHTARPAPAAPALLRRRWGTTPAGCAAGVGMRGHVGGACRRRTTRRAVCPHLRRLPCGGREHCAARRDAAAGGPAAQGAGRRRVAVRRHLWRAGPHAGVRGRLRAQAAGGRRQGRLRLCCAGWEGGCSSNFDMVWHCWARLAGQQVGCCPPLCCGAGRSHLLPCTAAAPAVGLYCQGLALEGTSTTALPSPASHPQCTFGPRLGDDDIRQLAEYVLDQANAGWPAQ